MLGTAFGDHPVELIDIRVEIEHWQRIMQGCDSKKVYK